MGQYEVFISTIQNVRIYNDLLIIKVRTTWFGNTTNLKHKDGIVSIKNFCEYELIGCC